MNETATPPSWIRSPALATPQSSALLIIDVQEKLLPAIYEPAKLAWNLGRLIRGADVLGVPTVLSEQYPQGLGATVPSLLEQVTEHRPPAVLEKRMFSCREIAHEMEQRVSPEVDQWILAGIETHVCVAQTALDLVANGYDVLVVTDAVGSRYAHDYEIALKRLEAQGCGLTTTEAILFEWCESSRNPHFKTISGLIRESAPGGSG